MGIIVSVIVIGVAIASYITGNIVDDLKDQIQAIIKAHQNDVDTVKRLKVLVEKLDAKALKDAMKKMSESSRANFQTILSDQESKIALLKSMSVNEDQAKDYDSTISRIINVVTYVFNIAMALELMLAPETGPIGWAVFTALTVLLGTILSIFTLIGNIKQIEQLKDKKNQLNEYFKPGGEFQNTQKNLRELSLQVVEDFHIFVITFRSMLNENYALISMLSLDESFKNYDYSTILAQLEQSPFTKEFEDLTEALVRDMREADKEQDMSRKLQLFVKKLDYFESNTNIDDKLYKAQKLIQLFDQKTILSIQMAKELKQMKGITDIISEVTPDFKKRETLDQPGKVKKDMSIGQHLTYIVSSDLPNRNLQMALVVAFFTDSFYGDDQTGKTFLTYDLKTLSRRATLINCIGSSADNSNHVLLPEPSINSSEHKRWQSDKDRLNRSCIASVAKKYNIPIDQLQKASKFDKMYLRFENVGFKYNNVDYNRLVLVKGIVLICMVNNLQQSQLYQEKLQDGHFEQFHSKSLFKVFVEEKVQTFNYSGKNLQQLASFSCSYVNGGVSLEKVKEINITEQGQEFKLVVQSSNLPLHHQRKFKFLDCFVAKGKEEVAKKDFYLKKFESENKAVNSVAELGESLVFWLIS